MGCSVGNGAATQAGCASLAMARAMDLQVPADHPLATAFATLDQSAGSTRSPVGVTQPFGTTWKGLIEQEDRAIALGCYRAATLMALKRGLRNGSIAAAHSVDHRRREDRLIPGALWERDRGRLCATSGVAPPASRPWRRQSLSAHIGGDADAAPVKVERVYSWRMRPAAAVGNNRRRRGL